MENTILLNNFPSPIYLRYELGLFISSVQKYEEFLLLQKTRNSNCRLKLV